MKMRSMAVLSRILAPYVVLVCLAHACLGHSTQNQRLGRIDSVAQPTIQLVHSTFKSFAKRSTLSHFSQLAHDDAFVLEFDAFGRSFAVYLQPNLELLHPAATTTVFDDETGTSITTPLRHADHRLYKGQVLSSIDHFLLANHLFSDHDLNQWARITIRHDIEHDHPFPLFEGTFAHENDLYHIKTTESYHLAKRHDDPALQHAPLIIYRDSDLVDDTSMEAHDPLAALMPRAPLPSASSSTSSASATTSAVNSSNSNASSNSNTPDTNLNRIICAMEELKYNQKLTGYVPSRNHSSSMTGSSSSSDDSLAVLWNKRSLGSTLQPRDTLTSSSLQGCPTSRKIAYMGAAADCSYTTAYNGIRLAKSQILTDWNIASAVYERTFNISLGLIYLEMSKPGCSSATQSQANNWNQDCSSTYTISNRLSDFSFWRGQRGDDQASLWHLMTQCATGVKVGIAWLSQLCEFQASQQIEDNGSYDWVSGTGVSSIVRDEWKVVAHEVGHGFGAIHDCTPQTCSCAGGCGCCPLSSSVCSAGDTYLMNPTSNVTTNDFSPCSISDICTSFPNIGYCLKSPGDINNSTFHICGNGILEPGEQCDPGGTDTACCNAKNCTLKPQAQCDDYSSLCCINCGVAPQGTVCRPAASECDSDEVCSGTSTQCPADEYDPDGTPCANNTMQCASGICTSRDEQCVARGLRLNITHQCPFQEDSCQITCADPSDSQNCLVLSGIFLDGTECGLAGFCRGGSCVSSGLSNTINAWVQKNLNIAIPVFVFGGLFILALLGLLVWFIRRRYLRRRDFKDKNSRPSSISSSRYGDDGENYHHGGGGGNNGRGGLPPPSAFGNTHAGPQLRAANLLGYVDTTPRHSQYSNTSHASHRTTPSMTPPATVESSTPSESWEMHTFSSYEQPTAQTPQLRHDTAMDPNKTTQTDDQSQISRRSIYPTDGNVVIATGAERRLSANWS